MENSINVYNSLILTVFSIVVGKQRYNMKTLGACKFSIGILSMVNLYDIAVLNSKVSDKLNSCEKRLIIFSWRVCDSGKFIVVYTCKWRCDILQVSALINPVF